MKTVIFFCLMNIGLLHAQSNNKNINVFQNKGAALLFKNAKTKLTTEEKDKIFDSNPKQINVQQPVRQQHKSPIEQNERMCCLSCVLDFFVTFFIKKKSKEHYL